MAAKIGFCLLTTLIFLGYFSSVFATESTVFISNETDKNDYDASPSTTDADTSAFIEDTSLAGSIYEEQRSTESISDVSVNDAVLDSFVKSTKAVENLDEVVSETNVDSIINTDNYQSQKTVIDNNDKNATNINAANISEPADNSTNKTAQPFWSCAKYNLTRQNVIILKDKNDLIWWLDELNKTMACAVVLFYAKWCYFSAKLAPMYNAVGRAFPGVPVLAIDAYTHNSVNTRYGIVGVPTIILFQESRPVMRFNRSRTFKDLVEFIHQSTGMEYNASVEVSQIDYNEGPLASTPSEEFNFYLFGAVCFLLCSGLFVLWRLQYIEIFVEYFTSFMPVQMVLGQADREKDD